MSMCMKCGATEGRCRCQTAAKGYIFSYWDNSGPPHVILEVVARGVSEADQILEEVCQIKATKSGHIGCRILREFTFEPMTEEKADWVALGGYDHFR